MTPEEMEELLLCWKSGQITEADWYSRLREMGYTSCMKKCDKCGAFYEGNTCPNKVCPNSKPVGWICPVCGSGVAPDVRVCQHPKP